MKQPSLPGYVPVAYVYRDDGWYGDRTRYILQPETDVNYRTKTEAKKMAGKLKKHMKALSQEYPSKTELQEVYVEVAEYDSLVDYKYNSFGPSLSYNRRMVTEAELKQPKTKAQLEEEYRWGMK